MLNHAEETLIYIYVSPKHSSYPYYTMNIVANANLVMQGVRASEAHDEVIKWKHFPRYWPFVPGIHRSPVNSPHKGQWRGALMFSLICAWINCWVNNREAGDLRCYRAHYDVIVMQDNDIFSLEYSWPHIWLTHCGLVTSYVYMDID